MTGVKTGVKGDFQANIAPKMPEFDPPVPAPNENEFGNTTHTQVPHKSHTTSTKEVKISNPLILGILKIFKNSHINAVITSRGKS